MSSLNIQTIKNEKFGKMDYYTLKITPKNKVDFEIDDVNNALQATISNLEKKKKRFQTLVSVKTPTHSHWTLKGFNDDDINVEEYEDYWSSRVRNTKKFEKFDAIYISMKVFN